MYLYKCDICGHLQEDKDEKFYALTETTRGVRGFNADICEKCFKKFQNMDTIKEIRKCIYINVISVGMYEKKMRDFSICIRPCLGMKIV